ncbi:MAG: hypothetical protein P8R54_02135 [Myxococcota bacterium]|nr:hypothetical protein [Myxococcota bacterium]
MPCFADARLFEPTLPLAYAPLLADMASFMAAVKTARASKSSADIAEVRRLHDALMVQARILLPPERILPLADAEAAFFSGGIRASRYRETVLGEPPLVDTAGSQTLSSFEVDVDAAALEAVHRAFTPDAMVREATAARLEEELSQLRLRQAIMAGLDRLFPMRPEADNRAAIDACVAALYPGHPLHSDEVAVIRTSTALFVCIPFSDGVLTTRDDPRIRAFIEELTDYHPSFSAHFPSFGSLTSGRVAAPLLAALAAETGLTESLLQETLPTMVVVLPTDKIDQYIVHDAWGHGWQALLFRFEETYQRVAGYTALPRLDQAVTRSGRTLTLRGVLEAQIARQVRGATLVTADWDAWLEAATAERLYDALSGLNAEVLADVVEYKYLALRPEDAALMPSSSFVKELPTKLDLTLLDMDYYYRCALAGFRRFGNREAAEDALVAALCASGLPEAETAAVVDAFAGHVGAWLDGIHGAEVGFAVVDGVLQTNTFSRVALNYLGLHVQFNDLYAALMAQRGDVRFADLLVFSTAAYLEEDWEHHFWHLDAFLDHFPDLLARYEDAL